MGEIIDYEHFQAMQTFLQAYDYLINEGTPMEIGEMVENDEEPN